MQTAAKYIAVLPCILKVTLDLYTTPSVTHTDVDICVCVAQCHSKDEVARKTAAEASERLARLCSECEAVEKLIRHFFDILSGESCVGVTSVFTVARRGRSTCDSFGIFVGATP